MPQALGSFDDGQAAISISWSVQGCLWLTAWPLGAVAAPPRPRPDIGSARSCARSAARVFT